MEEAVWRVDKRGRSWRSRAPQRAVREGAHAGADALAHQGLTRDTLQNRSACQGRTQAWCTSTRLENDLARDLIAGRARADDAIALRGNHDGDVVEVRSPARLARREHLGVAVLE